MPPWPRGDVTVAREDAKAGAKTTCIAGKPAHVDSMEVVVDGSGATPTPTSFVRARSRMVASTTSSELRLVNGKADYGTDPTTGTVEVVPSGKVLPVDQVPLMQVMQVSCFELCAQALLLNMHVGQKVRGTCSGGTVEVELIAIGGEELFRQELGY
jgi:hypothetical protein